MDFLELGLLGFFGLLGFLGKVAGWLFLRDRFISYFWLLVVTMDKAVKIDFELLADVEAFINLDENRFRYVNRKQFIDMAVADYLRRMKG